MTKKGSRRADVADAANDAGTASGSQAVLRSLGATIRGSRQAAGLTLQQLAQKSNLSISYLSQVERNILTPSVSTLKRLADLLDIPATELMFGGKDGSAPRAVGVVRKGHRKGVSLPGSNIHYELLTPDLQRRSSMLWLVAPPGSESGPAFVHEGEDGVLVLKGELEIEVGGENYQLAEGDSIYFSASLPHCWRNITDENAEAIWLSTPPSF